MTTYAKRFWPWRLADSADTSQVDETITSAQLRSYITDESGTGAALFVDGNIGAATATTPATGDNDTSVATTAFVKAQGYGAGDVAGPASATDNAVARFDGTGGKTLQNSVLIVDDAGATSGISTLQTSGNVGLGVAPSATAGTFLITSDSNDRQTIITISNTNSSGTTAQAVLRAAADTAATSFVSHGTARTVARCGVTLGGYAELLMTAGNGLVVDTIGTKPIILGTNSAAAVTINGTTQATKFHAPAVLNGYTVATLPAGVIGYVAYATDLLAPAFLVAAVGGGAVVGPVFYNGAAWVSF